MANRNPIKVRVKKLAADHYLMQVGKGRGGRDLSGKAILTCCLPMDAASD